MEDQEPFMIQQYYCKLTWQYTSNSKNFLFVACQFLFLAICSASVSFSMWISALAINVFFEIFCYSETWCLRYTEILRNVSFIVHVFASIIFSRSLFIKNYNLVLILVLVCSLQNLCLSFTYNARLLSFCLSVCL